MPTRRRRNIERFPDRKRDEALRAARERMSARLGLGPDKARQLDDILLDVLDDAVGVLIRGGPPPTEIVLDNAPTAENSLSGEVTNRIMLFDTDEPGPGGYQSVHIILRPEDATQWATQMMLAAGRAWDKRAESWRLGDCATCRNTRFTKDPDNPRSSDHAIHCPDCCPGPDPDAYPAAVRSRFAPPTSDETRRDDSTS